jgi:hypothetical protein
MRNVKTLSLWKGDESEKESYMYFQDQMISPEILNIVL